MTKIQWCEVCDKTAERECDNCHSPLCKNCYYPLGLCDMCLEDDALFLEEIGTEDDGNKWEEV